MPSPFPGMDPYLDDPEFWPDVHHNLITGIKERLNVGLDAGHYTNRYVARVELGTFVVGSDDPAEELYVIPDARIIERKVAGAPLRSEPFGVPGGGVAITSRPLTAIDVTGLVPRVARQRYIEIRDASDRTVVTVIEIVSPSNKVKGSAGRRAFRRKRDRVHSSSTNWFGIDLLRRGTSTLGLPRRGRSLRRAYRAYTDRRTGSKDKRQQIVWPIGLRERLPILPVPLRPGEADVPLDLQAVLDAAYDRARHDFEFDYTAPPAVPLDPDDAAWSAAMLAARTGPTSPLPAADTPPASNRPADPLR